MNAADLDDLLDQYAQQLTNTGNLDDLLDAFLNGLGHMRGEVLAHLVREQIEHAVMVNACVLDETAASTYEVLQQAADILLDTIRAQGREEDALQQLAAAYLARRAELNTLH